MQTTTALSSIADFIEKHAAVWQELSEAIWQKPELGYEEVAASAKLAEMLQQQGFTVQKPYCGLPTALRGEYGRGTPTFAIAAEYDALPEIGHGCGHNLIAAAALAAAAALKEQMLRENIPGRLVLLGTPAEESKGGKVKMLEQNCLDDIDAVMMLHPSWQTIPDLGSTAICRYDVEFAGLAAHAAGSPELGLNALDAVLMLFNAVNAWRQQLPESSRVHGIILKGGVVPNVIPDYAHCRFFLRSTDEAWVNKMTARFMDIVKGAELMTGTTATVKPSMIPYQSRKPNQPMNDAYIAAAQAMGLRPNTKAKSGRGSSDFGNFSRTRPGIHAYFSISESEIPGHSLAFAQAARSELGQTNMRKAAAAMAAVGYRYFTDPAFRQAVSEDFQREA
ncbi:MAG: M20 family metallopeptidase [Lentisphaerae bacterium]|nr:M20 family metallopeptidase [Lentisphaerota bacterium]